MILRGQKRARSLALRALYKKPRERRPEFRMPLSLHAHCAARLRASPGVSSFFFLLSFPLPHCVARRWPAARLELLGCHPKRISDYRLLRIGGVALQLLPRVRARKVVYSGLAWARRTARPSARGAGKPPAPHNVGHAAPEPPTARVIALLKSSNRKRQPRDTRASNRRARRVPLAYANSRAATVPLRTSAGAALQSQGFQVQRGC